MSSLYGAWAKYYDALHANKPYDAEAARVLEIVRRHNPMARTLLDVACGTGQHLLRLREHFDAEGLDASDALLDVARRRCGNLVFHAANMETFDLERRYDVVLCLFSSIAFATSKERLDGTVRNMARHLAGNGLLIVEPWFAPETFWSGTVTMNVVNEKELKIAWVYTSAREGATSVLNNHFLVGTPEGIEHAIDVHTLGLFRREEYQSAFAAAGLELVAADETGWPRGILVGRMRES